MATINTPTTVAADVVIVRNGVAIGEVYQSIKGDGFNAYASWHDGVPAGNSYFTDLDEAIAWISEVHSWDFWRWLERQ